MQETKISLKLKHGEEIRRISLNEKSFISLQKQIKEIFALNEGAFTLKYKDEEGDLVTIASDEELIESLQFTVNNLLKIEIISNSEEKGGRCGRKGIRSGIRSRKCDEKEQKDESPHQPFTNHPFHHRGPIKHAEHQIPPFPFHHGGFFQPGNVPSFNPFQPFHRNENEQPSHCRGPFKHPEHPFHNSKGNLNPPHPFHRVPFHCGGFFQPENVPSFNPFQGENKEYARGEFPFFDNLKEIALNLFANPFNQNQDQNAEKEKGETEEESFLEELLNNALFDIESIQSNTPSSHQSNVSQPKEQSVEPLKIDMEQKIEENVQQELFETTKEPETEIPSNSNEKVEEKVVYPFEQKLQDLSTMGFDDRKKNILALVQNKGDVQLAIEYLLQN